VELAIATQIPVREWFAESDEVIATALVVLEDNRKQIEKRR
jgi:hypothetical protein